MTISSPLEADPSGMAEDVLFSQTGAFPVLKDGVLAASQIKGIVAYSIKQFENDTAGILDYVFPAVAADSYQRGVDELESITDDGQKQMEGLLFGQLNSTLEIFDDVRLSPQVITMLGNTALYAALLRPKGLVVPKLGRDLRSSDLKETEHPSFAELFRHRLNFMRKIASSTGNLRRKEKEALRGFTTDGIVDSKKMSSYLVGPIKERDPEKVRLLQRCYMSNLAIILLPLFYAEPNAAEEARSRFVDRTFDVLRELGIETITGTVHEIEVLNNAKKHILSGDVNGGGHHIPSLPTEANVQFIGQIHGGVKTSFAMVDVALKTTERKGQEKRVVSSFFPSAWSQEEVVKAVSSPERVVYRRSTDGTMFSDTYEEVIYANGVLAKRIVAVDKSTDVPRIITAYPIAEIPAEMRALA